MRGQPSPTSDVVLNARLRQIQGTLEGENTEERSIFFMSALVGALLLSRSVENPELARQILDVTRIFLNQAPI
jgi:hypothetical protein